MPPHGNSPEAPKGAFDRDTALRRLREEQYDLLVIGGGITGAGVALDAASRGLRTALVEREDFASGTSSRSSKLIHGGLRYVQQREFRLVYEALHERQRLIKNAPHLVSVLPFLIPLFGKDGAVNEALARAYSSALWLYDVTGGIRIGKRHRRIDQAEALTHLPTLRADRLTAGFLYFDARADDARLTLTVARTAAVDFGAVLANYTTVTAIEHDAEGAAVGALARSTIADPKSPAGEEFLIRAKVIVNSTGVWADDTSSLDLREHMRSIKPAKGVHVTVPKTKLPSDIAIVVPVPHDRRSIFVVPWPDGDDVYLGTTDTEWDGSLDDPACLPEDVDYVLAAVNASVTEPLSRSDVTGVWAGVRPLLSPTGRQVSQRTADLSRRHTVRVSRSGVVTVTGGKLTTYRRMAQETVDRAVKILDPKTRSGVRRCRTKNLPLRGSDGYDELQNQVAAAAGYGLDRETFTMLLRRYGGETPAVLALAQGKPELLQPLVEGVPDLLVEAVWAVRKEMAMTFEDVFSRRTRSTLRRAEDAARAAPAAANLLASEWGRPLDKVEEEAAAFARATLYELERAGLDVRRRQSSDRP